MHLTGVGSCTITAHQAGTGNYSAAFDVARTFAITANAAPETTVTGGPFSPTTSSTATFTFTGTDVTSPAGLGFECRLDAGIVAACTIPATYTGVTEGRTPSWC